MRRQARRGGALRTVADHQQLRGRLATHAREHLDDRRRTLDRPEVRDVDEDLLAVRGEAGAQRADVAAAVQRAVDEVGNDPDVARHPELAIGIGLEALRDGGHAVGLLDAEGDGFRVRRIAAEQRDVGAVQRRDDARHDAAAARRQNLPRQIGRGRMRHRVVRVHDVELLGARDLHDLVGQRQQILRFAKQRIAGRFDAMKGQSRLVVVQAHRRVRAENVHAVSPRREHLAQFRRDDAAAADRGIADDADVHRESRVRLDRSSGSRTTNPSAQRTPASAPNCASRLSISCRNSGVFSRVAAVAAPAG